MRIAGIYSFNGAQAIIERRFQSELDEVTTIIQQMDALPHKTKISQEKTMPGRVLYKPGSLNKAFAQAFTNAAWHSHRVYCEYPTQYYVSDYTPPNSVRGAFREMDFIKNRMGLEVQFDTNAFMISSVCAKMTIFRNDALIEAGIEIVPVKELAAQMSSGVSYFEQFVWDLEHRGISNIDIPVLIIGIAP